MVNCLISGGKSMCLAFSHLRNVLKMGSVMSVYKKFVVFKFH